MHKRSSCRRLFALFTSEPWVACVCAREWFHSTPFFEGRLSWSKIWPIASKASDKSAANLVESVAGDERLLGEVNTGGSKRKRQRRDEPAPRK